MYHWNKEKRRYEENGKPVPPERIRQWLEDFISANKQEIDDESSSLLAGGASVLAIAAFFSYLKEKVKEMHGASGMITYGGEEEMNAVRWSRIGERIASETGYLEGFQQAVIESRQATDQLIHNVISQVSIAPESVPEAEAALESAILGSAPSTLVSVLPVVVEGVTPEIVEVTEPLWDSMIWGEVGSRARSYADATYSTYANEEKAREMDAGVTLGRRVCLDDDSSCDDCPALATEEYLTLDEIADIGDSQCQNRCRCQIEFSYEGVEPVNIDRGVYA